MIDPNNAFRAAWAEYRDRYLADVLPALKDSTTFLSIASESGEFDVRQATDIGAALLLDKPVILLIPKGRKVGARLRRAADVVLDDFDHSDPISMDRLKSAIAELG